MSPSSDEISVAKTLIETVMIVLPIWLAAIRYFIDEFEGEKGTKNYFVQMIVLTYFSLAVVLVSSSVVITNISNNYLSASIFGLWLLFFTTGAITFRLLERRSDSDSTQYLLWIGMIAGTFFLVLSFVLVIWTNF